MSDLDPAATVLRALEDDLVELALRRAPTDEVLERVAAALCEAGVRISEIRLAASTLHPKIDAIGVTWTAGVGIDTGVFRHSDSGSEAWLRSPLYHMIQTNTPRMHRRLTDPAQRAEFAVFQDMWDDGLTEYLAHLIGFGPFDGVRREGLIARWMTRHPDGFRDADIAVLDRIAGPMGAAILPGLERSIARNLVDAYVGARAGAQVLDGSIQPGEAKALDAVILVVDLGGFTAASDAVPPDRLAELLDRHFEAMVPPVVERGGEILAFLGDGFLAAFELGSESGPACTCALDAAIAAVRGVAEIGPALDEDGLRGLPLEAALHVGTVRYGNVGAGGRQAFTVIGPAVNAASRIEALCRPLGHPILASEAFATMCGDPRLVPVGAHRLKGVNEPITLYALG